MRKDYHLMDNSGKVNYTTPRWLLEALPCEFDLDPCACPSSPNKIGKLENFYLPDKDGLREPWPETHFAFVNPPYGKNKGEAAFLEKLSTHSGGGIALILFKGDTEFWRKIVFPMSSCIFVLDGRLHFNDENGVPTDGFQPQAGLPCWIWRKS